MSGLPFLQRSRNFMRFMRNGQRKNKSHTYDESGEPMSELRLSILEKLLNIFNYIGDHSGCHQIPERCFCIKGYTFPLCARCTGVFIGQTSFFLLFLFHIRPALTVCLLALSIMGIDWGLQYIKILPSTNMRRFFSGISGGYGVFGIYYHIFKLIVSFFTNL